MWVCAVCGISVWFVCVRVVCYGGVFRVSCTLVAGCRCFSPLFFGRFVGLVFGLFVCAMFVTALFFRFGGVRQPGACTYMVGMVFFWVGV